MYLNNYQSFIFGAVILGLLSFIACEKTGEANKVVGFGVKTDFKQSESVWFGADTLSGLQITVKEINDSRCPNDPEVQCVWGGEASVKLLATDSKDSLDLMLKIDPAKNSTTDTVPFTIGSKQYKALLFSVNPYPSTKIKMVKSATLTVLR
ncbi:MAG TPA: hypothetical protein VF273_05880 [Pelobium sp.]